MGRFINADGLVSTGQGVLGYNMYAYCGNNPVNRKDDGGEFWDSIVSALKTVAVATVIVAAAVAVTVATGGVGAAVMAAGGSAALAASATSAVALAGVTAAGISATAATTALVIETTQIATENVVYSRQTTPTSPNQMRNQKRKGQAPKEVKHIHDAHQPDTGGKPHVHYQDGTSMNIDGTIHDKHGGVPKITNSVKEWLQKNGWEYRLMDR